PDWEFSKIVEFARQHQYGALEVRGILRELDLTRCKEFSTPANRKETLTRMRDANLVFINLGSSCTLHFPEGESRNKNLDEGRRYIDLAAELNCPNIRVFPNNFPKEQDRQQTMEWMVSGLLTLSEYAKGTSVNILLESHGDLVYVKDLISVMEAASRSNIGLIWDFTNMWSVTRENLEEVFPLLRKYIRHVHVKDARLTKGTPQYCLLGRGDIPVKQAIGLLRKADYAGYYSFEWEKLWHPEILEPEEALSDYVTVMHQIFNQ
ncbi:MAG: sugar phosphate isomerase/epimerase family protein, partial [Chitinophagaceae bacterium]